MYLQSMFNFLTYINRVKLKLHFNSNYSFFSNCTYSTSKKQWKVVFYGTDDYSLFTLESLYLNRMSLGCDKVVAAIDVVCKKSNCDVRKYATENNIKIFAWPHELPENVYDIGIVVSFGHLIPKETINACKYGMINAHPSLLPRWRGAAPTFKTILHGDAETGVTIIEVSPNKFDVGKILLQEKYKIPADTSNKELTVVLGKMAAAMILKVLSDLTQYIESSIHQPKTGSIYAHKIKPTEGCINWAEDSIDVIWRKYKAFDGYIAVYSFWKERKVGLLEFVHPDIVKSVIIPKFVAEMEIAPGFCYFHNRKKILFIKCQDGWCGVLSVKIPNTGNISAQEFYNGFVSKLPPDQCYFRPCSNNKST